MALFFTFGGIYFRKISAKKILRFRKTFYLCKRKYINIATITVEIGKKGKRDTRTVNFLVCHGKSKKRIPTELYVLDSDLSKSGKVINTTKARLIEEMRRKLEDRLFALAVDLMGRTDIDAAYIAERLLVRPDELEFFKFADEWLERSNIKGKKNYTSMLSSLEQHLGRRHLRFSSITYSMLQRYEDYLKGKPRAQSLYLGEIRHLYRQCSLQAVR